MANVKLPRNELIENAEIWMATRNFAGHKNKFGSSQPGFCVFLDTKKADDLSAKGWTVKMAKPREEGDDPRPYIQVAFQYNDEYPHLNPEIWKHTQTNDILMDPDTVATLDNDIFESVDVVIRPRYWEMGANSGIKAYVKEMHIVVEESILARKYTRRRQDLDNNECPWSMDD